MSRIDVVVPCYKYGHFLRECVESVLSQPVELRVLIIDDASPDDTEKVAKELATQDHRVEYRRHSVNQRNIATYNEGLEWATGEYSLVLSADDALVPGALARAIHLLDAEPSVGLVCGRELRFQFSDSKPSPLASYDHCAWKVIKGSEFIETVCSNALNPVSAPTAIIRTALLREVGLYRFDLPHSADMAMWLTYAAYADVAFTDAHQAYYRVHLENMSGEMVRDPLVGLRQRKLAFEALFEDAGHRLDNLESLRRSVFTVLAFHALTSASLAFYERNLNHCREALKFAEVCWPDVVHQKGYRRLAIKRRVGPTTWNILRGLTFRRPFPRGPWDNATHLANRLQIDDLRTFEDVLAERRGAAR
jgi:glycosyltransferase involved in cell wall biosynthesis